ncbi:PREDICTED: borealin, partial [Merops nubicus]|uniref:borealin n=1 Tax=Merops nubicus TaxID=57421 RepID=UPI0004F09F9C
CVSSGIAGLLRNPNKTSSTITPAAGRVVDGRARGGSSVVRPRFESRVFHKPADSSEAFITLPLREGESIHLIASDLTRKNLLHLNQEAQGVKKLSVRLAQACDGARTQR